MQRSLHVDETFLNYIRLFHSNSTSDFREEQPIIASAWAEKRLNSGNLTSTSTEVGRDAVISGFTIVGRIFPFPLRSEGK